MLKFENFSFTYGKGRKDGDVLEDINLYIKRNECLGIIGESGSGKTTLGLNIMRLARGEHRGNMIFDGMNLHDLDEKAMMALRGSRIAMSFQSPGTSLNPVLSVSKQVAEPLICHGLMKRKEAKNHAVELLREFGISRPDAFPHQLSGGQQQKVMLAMAAACNPELLIIDEPTSNLDSISKLEIMQKISEFRKSKTMMIISHEISIIPKLCDKIAVIYGGRILEYGDARKIIDNPGHPYTFALINSYPTMTMAKNLTDIRGQYEPFSDRCRFVNRCTQAISVCSERAPVLKAARPGISIACHRGGIVNLIESTKIRKKFTARKRFKREEIRAVNGVDLFIREGESVALIGETGSGKTTVGKILCGILEPDEGRVVFQQHDLGKQLKKQPRKTRRKIQMIFQDAAGSINPRLKIVDVVREPLIVQKMFDEDERIKRVKRVLGEVGLPSRHDFLEKYSFQLSSGELQRVALARALVLGPKLIIADEITSNLDASLQAKAILRLKRIQKERGMGLLLITHDIALARKVCDRLLVLLEGKIVEEGASSAIISDPIHPYTRSLLDATPTLCCSLPVAKNLEIRKKNNEGCSYYDRCRYSIEDCDKKKPKLDGDFHHRAACLANKIDVCCLHGGHDHDHGQRHGHGHSHGYTHNFNHGHNH